MARWCAALIALGITALPALAQGPGMVSEPVPVGTSTLGGQQPSGAPCPPSGGGEMGGISLPSNLLTAWDERAYMPPAVYGSIGYMGMSRDRLGHGVIAFRDLDSANPLVTPGATGNGVGVDTGLTPRRGTPQFADYNDILPRMNSGVKLSLGYHWETYAIEASGFHLGQSDSSELYARAGQLDLPFNVRGVVTNFPTGFNGDNILWLQADIVRTSLQTSMSNAEASMRWWLGYDSDFSWSLGVRYMQIYERFGIYVGDNDLVQRDIDGNPDPTQEMLYQTTVNNHLAAAQLGLEWSRPVGKCFAFTMQAKGAWGANFVDFDTLLKRGDGFTGFKSHNSSTIFSHVYELGFFMNMYLIERVRLRAGYNLLWACHIAEAADQVNFDLSDTRGRRDFDGSAFWHGPLVEFHVLF